MESSRSTRALLALSLRRVPAGPHSRRRWKEPGALSGGENCPCPERVTSASRRQLRTGSGYGVKRTTNRSNRGMEKENNQAVPT